MPWRISLVSNTVQPLGLLLCNHRVLCPQEATLSHIPLSKKLQEMGNPSGISSLLHHSLVVRHHSSLLQINDLHSRLSRALFLQRADSITLLIMQTKARVYRLPCHPRLTPKSWCPACQTRRPLRVCLDT